MKLSSPEFSHNGYMPKKFTCEGEDVSPALLVSGIPQEAKFLALVVDDPDAPAGDWVHWIVFDIPLTSRIEEGGVPGTQGINDFGRLNYGGPCPPSGTHRYSFKIYAQDQRLGLASGIDKPTLKKALKDHTLAQAELVGLYKRSDR